jgi:C1A family cysteine protease
MLYKAPALFPAVTLAVPSVPNLSEQHAYYCVYGAKCNDGWWIDTGATLVASAGAYDETCLPYSTTSTSCSTTCGVAQNWAKNGSATSIQAVALNTWDAVRSHIVNYGPVSTGFTVYSDFPGFADSSFYLFDANYVWPGTKTNRVLGGHAVMCYGFDDNMLNGQTSTSTGVLFCKNSWGTNWGNQGHYKVAYGADGIMSGDANTYG